MYFFVNILKEDFQKRKRINKRYSLRSYANFLDISPSSLSSILKAQRAYPTYKISDFFSKVSLDDKAQYEFMTSITHFQKDQKRKSKNNKTHLNTPDDLGKLLESNKYFAMISEWEYFAFLNLIKLSDIKWNHQYFADRLNIQINRIDTVINNLLTFNLIEKDGPKYIRTSQKFYTSNNISSNALKKAHQNDIQLAIDAISKIDIHKRNISSRILPGCPKKLKKAEKIICDFKDNISKLMEEGNTTEVYQLSIQLFPLTTPIIDKDKP